MLTCVSVFSQLRSIRDQVPHSQAIVAGRASMVLCAFVLEARASCLSPDNV